MRTILRHARIDGAEAESIIVIDGGVITEVLPEGDFTPLPEDQVEDVKSQIVMPSFVDGHSHADKSMWGEKWVRRTADEISMDQMFDDMIEQWKLPQSPVKIRARRFIDRCIEYGTTTMRVFADVAPEIGLDGVHAMLELKEELAEEIDLSVVAFPQLGIIRKPGTADLLDAALADGADAVGGLDPAGQDKDANAALDTVFGLAEKYQVPVDFHAHEDGELGVWLVDRIAERTKSLNMQGKVSMCDVFSLAEPTPEQLTHLSSTLADAGISITVGVHGLLPVPDINRLHDDGVLLCLGSDSARSLWSPWGEGDILARAQFLAYKKYWRTDRDLEFAASIGNRLGRKVFGIEPFGVEVGAPADLVVLPGEVIGELVVLPPPRSLVLKAGRIVARDGKLTRTNAL
ncbi:amidohydrolase family protein [Corynebacterium sp. AOP40-9SA-29]|uniref:amidohydrolase family protein n=1 Tax=Corynebacterium sp. AOP40-9SA-29 TaxID=3457677 RepID=UPI004033C140